MNIPQEVFESLRRRSRRVAKNAIHLGRPAHLAGLEIERPISELCNTLRLGEACLALAQVFGDHLGHPDCPAPGRRERMQREEQQQAGHQAGGERQPWQEGVGAIDDRFLPRAEAHFPDPPTYLHRQAGRERRVRIPGTGSLRRGVEQVVAVEKQPILANRSRRRLVFYESGVV